MDCQQPIWYIGWKDVPWKSGNLVSLKILLVQKINIKDIVPICQSSLLYGAKTYPITKQNKKQKTKTK